MKKITAKIGNFLREENGATAPEYGLIAGLIAVFIIGGVTLAGQSVSAVFNQIGTAITAAL